MTRTIAFALLLVLAVCSPVAAAPAEVVAEPGTNWVGRNADGSLQAFAVHEGRLVTWWQENGAFAPPAVLSAPGPVAPAVSVVSTQDGTLRVFARRADTGEIVTIAQNDRFGGFPQTWDSLGVQAGSPVAALRSDGRVRVVARNAHGGVSALVLGDGGWVDLGGTGVRDGLAVSGDEIFAHAVENGVGKIKHWTADGIADVDGPEPAGPPALSNGKLYYRLADGTVVRLSDGVTENLGGAGEGSVTVVAGTLIANRAEGLGLTRLDAPGWSEIGPRGRPAAAVDANGALQVFSLADDGTLRVTGIVHETIPATR